VDALGDGAVDLGEVDQRPALEHRRGGYYDDPAATAATSAATSCPPASKS